MWYGLTQRPGWEHSGFFSSRSPSKYQERSWHKRYNIQEHWRLDEAQSNTIYVPVLSSGIALNKITMTRSSRQTFTEKHKSIFNLKSFKEQTLSACRKQSIRRIFPFWSGLERTHIDCRLPVMLWTKSSRHSCVMSLRNFPSRRDAHFCLTSGFSFWKVNLDKFLNVQDDMTSLSYLKFIFAMPLFL